MESAPEGAPAALSPAPPREYRVRLEQFEGPLDLLLYLIRRAEVDIHDIPIAEIAEQFIAHLEQLDDAGSRVDIDTAGEFLVMAGTLVEIKSRMIQLEQEGADQARERAGREAGEDAEEEWEDPRADLVRQLLAYKRYRDAAEELEHRREEWAKRVPAARAALPAEALREAAEALGEIEIEDVGLWDLVEAFGKIIASVNFDRLGEHEVVSDETPIELHAEDIVDRLRRAGEEPGPGGPRAMTLRRVLAGRTRAEMVGLFLALLDLIRNERVAFRQGQDEEGVGDEIVIELREGAGESDHREHGGHGGGEGMGAEDVEDR